MISLTCYSNFRKLSSCICHGKSTQTTLANSLLLSPFLSIVAYSNDQNSLRAGISRKHLVIWFSITFEIVFAGRLSTCHEVDHKADQGARVVHQGGRSIRWGFAILCVHSWKVTVWEKATHAAYSIQIFRCENESSSTFQYSCPIHSYLASQKMFQKCISFHFEYAFCHWQAGSTVNGDTICRNSSGGK